ncbi:MAG: YdcF family protein, partial [Pseudomonadota bacterium]
GENDRIASAIKLLHAKHGKRLLISGVNHKVSKGVLKHSLEADPVAFSCCVDLDYLSMDTRGNAENASYWAEYHDYKILIIVTSDYHMPRSLLVMQREMPQVRLIPAPVVSADLKMASYAEIIFSPVIMKEFGKYLVVQLGMEPTAKYLLTVTNTATEPGKPS